MSHYVRIYYGPYESFSTLSHKPQRLRGLRDELLKLGYRVDLIPIEVQNYCMLELGSYEVFRCNIKHLQFNTPVESDPICKRAIDAVKTSNKQILRARTYFSLWSLIDKQIFQRSEYAPKNYWPIDIELKEYEDCIECAKCCHILMESLNQ